MLARKCFLKQSYEYKIYWLSSYIYNEYTKSSREIKYIHFGKTQQRAYENVFLYLWYVSIAAHAYSYQPTLIFLRKASEFLMSFSSNFIWKSLVGFFLYLLNSETRNKIEIFRQKSFKTRSPKA